MLMKIGLAMLIAIVALAITGIVSASEDNNVESKCVDLICCEETAWAAQKNPGEFRFVEKGSWATYVEYDFGNQNNYTTYPLFAGKDCRAGTLWVYDDTEYESDGKCGSGYYGSIYINYTSATTCDCDCKDGYDGSWKGFTEYHLQVVDEFDCFEAVRTFNKKLGWGNPIPGQFDYSEEYCEIKPETGWIEVEVCGYDCNAFIAAHSVMHWCGYPESD